ncbi:hypothetical protein HK101_001894 [Irineochytrium annulatum]|nr:hypothetical protein HK101_001894 [Irineochytrium annulatum]
MTRSAVLISALGLAAVAAAAAGPRVALDYGAFTGVTDSSGLLIWKGIPFAQPPVGPLRFKPPQNITASLGEVNANAYGPACPQASKTGAPFDGSEDCLQLNVWAPPNAKNLPVMIWIYGGSFTSGSTSVMLYEGANIAGNQMNTSTALIVVSINYRLGALGWLASDALAAEGSTNVGLLDQRAAMAWVQKYISNFGGDPTRVTVWGESAGAISISTHIFASPTPLFSQAIMESGSTFYVTETVKDMNPVFDNLAIATGCQTTDALACLRNTSLAKLMAADFDAQSHLNVQYAPIIDGTFIKTRPSVLLASPGYAPPKIPMIVGTNTNEGTAFTKARNNSALLPYISSFPGINTSYILDTLYPTDGTDAGAFNSSSLFAGDYVFNCPVRTMADAMSKLPSAVFKYRYNHVPEFNIFQAPASYGVYHAAELVFVFNDTMFMMADEKPLAAALAQFWANFAVSGDPNVGRPASAPSPKWPAYVADAKLTSGGGQRMRFDGGANGGLVVEVENDKQLQCAYWDAYVKTANLPPIAIANSPANTTTAAPSPSATGPSPVVVTTILPKTSSALARTSTTGMISMMMPFMTVFISAFLI